MKIRLCLSLLAVLVTVSLAACDSGDPIDQPEPRDVAGRYSFTEFEFRPTSSAVQPINVLDTLETSRTHLDLSSGGNFIFRYGFVAGDEYFLGGSFTVTERSVRIDGAREQRESYNRILLSEDFTLRRDETRSGLLTAEVPLTVNPANFSRRYVGITALEGTLHLRLEQQ